mgnify:CR=1 FL=1
MINKNSNIFLAGHNGMVGSAILRKLKEKKFLNIIKFNKKELDLTNQRNVINFFSIHKIDSVILAAAKVGGIIANNTYRSEILYENLMIQSNMINASFKNGIKDFIFLGSSCVYPNTFTRPIKESDLLSNYLEKTNEPYAIAKIAGLIMCDSFNKQYKRDYRVVMPTNLYGPGDNFHSCNSHVIPSLISRINKAKNNKYITIYTNSVVNNWFHSTDILLPTIKSLKATSINGNILEINSKKFIICAGTLESTRTR